MRSKNEIMCDINYNQLSNQKIMLELLLDIRELLIVNSNPQHLKQQLRNELNSTQKKINRR